MSRITTIGIHAEFLICSTNFEPKCAAFEQMLLKKAGGWHPAMELGEFEVVDLQADDDADGNEETYSSFQNKRYGS